MKKGEHRPISVSGFPGHMHTEINRLESDNRMKLSCYHSKEIHELPKRPILVHTEIPIPPTIRSKLAKEIRNKRKSNDRKKLIEDATHSESPYIRIASIKQSNRGVRMPTEQQYRNHQPKHLRWPSQHGLQSFSPAFRSSFVCWAAPHLGQTLVHQ